MTILGGRDREQVIRVVIRHIPDMGWIGETAEKIVDAIEAVPQQRDLQATDEVVKALRYLADPENWLGDPLDQTSTLHGHFTPYELAREALARGVEPPRCICPVGWGAVVAEGCPRHDPKPAHTVTGPVVSEGFSDIWRDKRPR